MSKELKVLLIEDSEEDCLLLLRELKRGGYTPVYERVETEPDMRRALVEKEWDFIISDYKMPAFDAPGALRVLHEHGGDIPFVIVSGKIGEDLAVAALKAGANDYLMKGNLARLGPVIERELRDAEDRKVHRSVQEAVRRGKAEWEAVFDAVSDIIIITDSEGIITRCNGRANTYFSCGYKALIGKRIDEIFFGADDLERRVFRFIHGAQGEVDEDIQFPKLDGWFNVASYPMRFSEDRTGIVFIIKDITKRKQVEEEKRTSDRELLTLYAVAFRLQYAQGVEKIMGDLLFQLHNMLQVEFSCIHLLDKGNLRLRACLGVSTAFEKSMAALAKGTKYYSATIAGKPFRGDDPDDTFPPKALQAAKEMGLRSWSAIPIKLVNEVMGVMTVATRSDRSYTERDVFLLSSIAGQLAVLIENHNLYNGLKEQAEELRRSREELKENLAKVEMANRELGRLNTVKNNFIGMASHELKTPITSILGGVEFLLKYADIKMSPEQRTIFTSVYEGTVQLRRLVEDLLSISRIEAHGPNLQKKQIPLMRLCRDVHDMLLLPLSERQIRVHIDVDETLVPVDEALAQLAIRNLMENAVKFTPDGGEVRLTGKVVKKRSLARLEEEVRPFYAELPPSFKTAKEFFVLEVKDTGIGIPAEERVRIFDKFYGVGDIAHHSSGNTAFMSKGTGLGLSIVRGIMDVHEGAVWVTGNHKGSVFSLLFPLK